MAALIQVGRQSPALGMLGHLVHTSTLTEPCVRPLEPTVIADLDTLLVALYVELTDAIIPSLGPRRRGPGRPPAVTDAELVCLAVAQVLLRYDDERHWLRAAPHRVGHLFPGCWAKASTTRVPQLMGI
jgi:hypothetical protein